MRIVSQAIRSDNGEAYQRAVAQARRGLEAAIAAQLPADASFADRERAVLAAANEVCRLTLEATLQATAEAHAGSGADRANPRAVFRSAVPTASRLRRSATSRRAWPSRQQAASQRQRP